MTGMSCLEAVDRVGVLGSGVTGRWGNVADFIEVVVLIVVEVVVVLAAVVVLVVSKLHSAGGTEILGVVVWSLGWMRTSWVTGVPVEVIMPGTLEFLPEPSISSSGLSGSASLSTRGSTSPLPSTILESPLPRSGSIRSSSSPPGSSSDTKKYEQFCNNWNFFRYERFRIITGTFLFFIINSVRRILTCKLQIRLFTPVEYPTNLFQSIPHRHYLWLVLVWTWPVLTAGFDAQQPHWIWEYCQDENFWSAWVRKVRLRAQQPKCVKTCW